MFHEPSCLIKGKQETVRCSSDCYEANEIILEIVAKTKALGTDLYLSSYKVSLHASFPLHGCNLSPREENRTN